MFVYKVFPGFRQGEPVAITQRFHGCYRGHLQTKTSSEDDVSLYMKCTGKDFTL